MSGWLTKKPAKKQQTPVKPKIKLLPDTPQYQKKFREESPSPSPPPNRLVGFTSSILMPPPPPRYTPKSPTQAELANIKKADEIARRAFAPPDTPSPSQSLSPPNRLVGFTSSMLMPPAPPPPNRLVGFTSSMPMPPAPPPKLLTEAEQLRIQESDKLARRVFAWQGTPSPSQLLSPPPKRDNTDIGSLDETQTQHESGFNLEEEHTQHASETETPTQNADSPNGGKMTRKKDKNKSKNKRKKGKSKSKKGKSKKGKSKSKSKSKNKRTVKHR
jgi:hypothetical protein|uniref:Uncharacterized protein n=1 Tax=viral metagenome TaxID=1070528 RepID=A0A6C0F0Z6_9ZZZZ